MAFSDNMLKKRYFHLANSCFRYHLNTVRFCNPIEKVIFVFRKTLFLETLLAVARFFIFKLFLL